MPPSDPGSGDEPAPLAPRRSPLPDPAPWRGGTGFARLEISGAVTSFGSVFTLVAIPLQVAEQTGSPLAVGAIGLAELLPTVALGLWGGAIADALDRRRILVMTEGLLGVCAVFLLINALIGSSPWPLFVTAAVTAGLQGLQQPALVAALPRLVGPPDLAAAMAWSSLRSSTVFVVGPVLAGVVVSLSGTPVAYALDTASFALSLAVLVGLPAMPPHPGTARRATPGGVAYGLGYLVTRPVLAGTYATDLAVTVLAFPMPLYPFLADALHARWSLGLLYASTGVGMLLASLTAGWTARVRHDGRLVLAASTGVGVCLVGTGLCDQLWAVLALLVAGGVAHGIGDIVRGTLWNREIPDHLRGRLAGAELVVGAGGPALGDLRAGVAGARLGLATALWLGGAACVAATGLVAAIPPLRRHTTDQAGSQER